MKLLDTDVCIEILRGNARVIERRRRTPDEVATARPADWTRLMKERRGPYQMAGLMSLYLQALCGERFLPAWVAYYRLAGQKGQSAAQAFEQSFGLGEAEFLADFKRWLALQ